jgi:hypothetical protein
MRRKAKKDTAQPDIVERLRDCGYVVEIQNTEHRPDLLVRHPSWVSNVWVRAEVKTPNAKGKIVIRKDRLKQHDFCQEHAVPYWISIEVAREYLRLYELRLSAQGSFT